VAPGVPTMQKYDSHGSESGVILVTLLSYWICAWHPPDEASLLSNFSLSW